MLLKIGLVTEMKAKKISGIFGILHVRNVYPTDLVNENFLISIFIMQKNQTFNNKKVLLSQKMALISLKFTYNQDFVIFDRIEKTLVLQFS